ncbi:f-box family protein [Corchorus olitorius]|uniref:F-box family protein n=1 Tax=Corchorus olitorius TaxID=93759 RepID=A0A1R3JZ50_9ROSI|nr:f-box family protein [Corchorus olitorius]
MDAVAGNLPDDVTRDILQRFPVKSILRFSYEDSSEQLGIRLVTHDPFKVYLDVDLPFTPNKHKTLPLPNINVSAWRNRWKREMAIGFGYDSLSNDYKIVFLYNEGDDVDEGYSKQLAQVYTLGMNLETPNHDLIIVDEYVDHSPAFLNGVIHWLGPKVIDVYRDMLCVVHSVRMMDKWNHDIWVMSKYGVQESWTKLLVLVQPLPGNYDLRGFMMNGELVLESCDHPYTSTSVAVDNGKSKPIIFEFDDGFYLQFSTYTQSLVSLI